MHLRHVLPPTTIVHHWHCNRCPSGVIFEVVSCVAFLPSCSLYRLTPGYVPLRVELQQIVRYSQFGTFVARPHLCLKLFRAKASLWFLEVFGLNAKRPQCLLQPLGVSFASLEPS